MIIEIDKSYKTRRGSEVKIYTVSGGGSYPVHGAAKGRGSDHWQAIEWKADGTRGDRSSDADLVEEGSIKRTVWINVFAWRYSETIHGSERSAKDENMKHEQNRIACIKVEIDCEEGFGLDE